VTPVMDEVLRQVRALPGIRAAGMATMSPLAGGVSARSLEAEPDDRSVHIRPAWPTSITPGYFEAQGIPLLSGRGIADADDASSEPVAVISARLARRLFDRRNPVGATMHVGDSTQMTRTLRIVGVAGDVHLDPRQGPYSLFYVPFAQSTGLPPYANLVIGTQGRVDSRALASEIEAAAPGIRPPRVSTMEQLLEMELLRERFAAGFASLFGVLALLLAAVGLYGVVAYSVARRTSEFGVRRALGARSRSVIGLVLRGSIALVVIGVVLAAPAVYVVGRTLNAMLFGLGGHDPFALGGSVLTLVGVALFASVVPASRAARVDPVVALRAE
jgi:predicted lysophospholipase L1 biosynthesis ABC-type transport system permease subunit